MQYRRLGRTGWQVSAVGLGGLFVAAEAVDTGIAVIQQAAELGVNLFDTAPSYRLGPEQVGSQEVLGRALAGVSQKVYVSTKVGPHPLFPDGARYDRDSILQQVEFNLQQLGRDSIDILHIHDPDRYGDRNAPGNLHPVLGRGMALETLIELKQQKVIGAIGLANLWLDYQSACVETGGFDVVVTFNRFGLIWRDAQFQSFPFCRRHDVGVMQGTPLHQGVLASPRSDWLEQPPAWMTALEHDRYRRLLRIQSDSGIALSELAIRFILHNPIISSTIPGAQNLDQLRANVACADKGPLPDDVLTQIEALGILHADPRRYY